MTISHRTKASATAAGRTQATTASTEHRIHNRNGQIGRSNSSGPDSNPPRGKNR